MKLNRVHAAIWGGVTCLLVGCQNTTGTSNDRLERVNNETDLGSDTLPCWLQTPVSDNVRGFIGTSAVLNAYGQLAIRASRKTALRKLAHFHKINLTDQDFSDVTAQDHMVISLSSGHAVTFVPVHITKAVIYSYAFIGSAVALPLSCSEKHCNFDTCSPQWLCSTDQNTITSVSYFTAIPHEQLAESERNAGVIASLLDTANVQVIDTQTELYQDLSGEIVHSIKRSRSGEVTAERLSAPLLHTRSCTYGNTFVAQYEVQRLIPHRFKLAADWKSKPYYQGRVIALGSFGEMGAMTADTLLSTAIDYAIKDALIELAKVKGVTVTSEVNIRFENGHYLLSEAQFSVNQVVSGDLIDIKVSYKNGKPIVYVWVLEVV
ncbi:hypothetical protein J8L98_19775 [Pseudoalteromonas sp. MMG013]|uniref:hypothetical protein n=1 Tax=Pseudoalteromonas sp. MMG013 TaxID=2822687 RepID=UPI001B38D7CD|nr:hypothetical protein [Pseudoalteromonas sp. MMG013]MBQ4863930.1 hypothetical protein [Pseudoalteromonas sp. MMG013]